MGLCPVLPLNFWCLNWRENQGKNSWCWLGLLKYFHTLISQINYSRGIEEVWKDLNHHYHFFSVSSGSDGTITFLAGWVFKALFFSLNSKTQTKMLPDRRIFPIRAREQERIQTSSWQVDNELNLSSLVVFFSEIRGPIADQPNHMAASHCGKTHKDTAEWVTCFGHCRKAAGTQIATGYSQGTQVINLIWSPDAGSTGEMFTNDTLALSSDALLTMLHYIISQTPPGSADLTNGSKRSHVPSSNCIKNLCDLQDNITFNSFSLSLCSLIGSYCIDHNRHMPLNHHRNHHRQLDVCRQDKMNGHADVFRRQVYWSERHRGTSTSAINITFSKRWIDEDTWALMHWL